MELTSRYGMEFNPFLKNTKEILFENTEYKEAVFRLNGLAGTKGFGILTGAPGRGKTTIVRNWVSGLSPSLYKVVYTCLSTVTVNDFYRNLAISLGSEASFRKTENFHSIQSEINRLSIEKRKTPVIIIDEANYVNNGILNDFKILFNFEMDSRDRAVILLVGLPNLNNTLRLSVHEPLRQRIIMNYNVEGFTKSEGREYIDFRLKASGCNQQVFDEPAIEAILNASDGTARMINKICHTALVIGHCREINVITADIVMKAINDSTIG